MEDLCGRTQLGGVWQKLRLRCGERQKLDQGLRLYQQGALRLWLEGWGIWLWLSEPFWDFGWILEPILVGIGMFSRGTIWILTHGHMAMDFREPP